MKQLIKKTPSLIVIFLILFPFFFVFLFKNFVLHLPSSSEWQRVFLSTFAQAGLSAFLSVSLGILGALGLLSLVEKPKKQAMLELFCLLPALVPPLITVMAYINISELFMASGYPFSFYSVLIVHVLMNIGLSACFFCRLFQRQSGLWPPFAFLHGANRWFLLKKLLLFEFRKDLILIFLLVFSFCWTSFSVPLLVGGVGGQTLEVFIAEKLKDPTTWPEALSLFMIETSFIFLFFLLLYGNPQNAGWQDEFSADEQNLNKPLHSKKLYLLPCRPLLVLPLLPSLLLIGGLIGPGLFSGQDGVWPDMILIKSVIYKAWAQSLLMGIGAGVLTFALLSLVAFALRDLFLSRFLVAYTGASTAFMGFAFLLIEAENGFSIYLKWTLGLSLLFLPALYRLKGESLLSRLRAEAQVANLMGASTWMSFAKIIYPQCLKTFFFLSGVSAFWAVGDFAYSSIVAGEQNHLALLIQDLLGSYRLKLATTLTWLLIVTGAFCFCLFTYLPSFLDVGKKKLQRAFAESDTLHEGQCSKTEPKQKLKNLKYFFKKRC